VKQAAVNLEAVKKGERVFMRRTPECGWIGVESLSSLGHPKFLAAGTRR
jgi:hypothetical protein